MSTDKRDRQRERRVRLQAALDQAQAKSRRRRRLLWGGLVLVVIAGLVALVAVLSNGEDEEASDDGTTTTSQGVAEPAELPVPPAGASITGDTPCPPADGSAQRTTQFEKAPPLCIDPSKSYQAVVHTSLGAFTIQLDPRTAPLATNNFVVLARYHLYDGIPFHRIVPGFVIQAGDPIGEPWGSHGPGYTFADELPPEGTVYGLGTVAMANSGPNTNGSQFFVVSGAETGLQASYTIFGNVTDGIDVVETIGAVPPTPNPTSGASDWPSQVVTIDRIDIIETDTPPATADSTTTTTIAGG
ncbi:MAG: hypothetical protein JJLCMIEE_01445 [Acidimicrobiales bacterium]|nr:MAG: peptidylprolyl isomerase [Actinomycetota bacterium]MBV6508385.1 hypothetical protein [Acidimicrobiales bacterium]RIK04801.1 MAG: peptidylprolyl isomerase [Acidobacteriota bacterium]